MDMLGVAVKIEAVETRVPPRLTRLLILAASALILICGVWRWWEVRRYRTAMAEIQAQMGAGQHNIAARNLIALLAWKPDSDQAAYLLGNCEQARGRTNEAAEAWARVRPGSPYESGAIRGRVELEVSRGRFADAENLVIKALEQSQTDKLGLAALLGPIYVLEGRIDDAVRLIERSWHRLREAGAGAMAAGIQLVREHIELQRTPTPVETVRSLLEQAAELAREDDRVWLGRANLALRVGSLDEAANWIDACLRRRPDDTPVWRARLRWAMATGRVEEFREALAHLPANELNLADVHKLASWLAAHCGDVDSERRALERLIAVDPADVAALDRLAELAVLESQPDRAADVRRKKEETNRDHARYQKLYERCQPTRDSAVMGRLAEQLGRWFEAKVFLTVALAARPDRDDVRRDLARVNRRAETLMSAGRSLAEVVTEDLQAATGPSHATAPKSDGARDP
jgi:enediyne biosynthesis protein E4